VFTYTQRQKDGCFQCCSQEDCEHEKLAAPHLNTPTFTLSYRCHEEVCSYICVLFCVFSKKYYYVVIFGNNPKF
jgi:hypothetical protein